MTASQLRFGRAMRLKVPIIPTIRKYWNASLRHTEIASLELEFHQLVSNPHSNAARASRILSTLAKLYQAELHEQEGSTEVPPPPPSITELAEPESPESREAKEAISSSLLGQCQSVINEAKQSMARAQGNTEIRAAFRKGVLELMDTLGKDGKLSL